MVLHPCVEWVRSQSAERNRYFRDLFNAVDFIVVVISIVSAASQTNGSIIVVARMFRVCSKLVRLIRTLKPLEGMKRILDTTIASFSSVLNVGVLLVLVISMFAIVGMNLFWNLPFDGVLTSHSNFVSFGNAMLGMFRVATVSLVASVALHMARSGPKGRRRQSSLCAVVAGRQLERSFAFSCRRALRHPRCRWLRRNGRCGGLLLHVHTYRFSDPPQPFCCSEWQQESTATVEALSTGRMASEHVNK